MRQRDERLFPARCVQQDADEVEERDLLALRGLEVLADLRIELVEIQIAVVKQQAGREARDLRVEVDEALVRAGVDRLPFLLDFVRQQPDERAVRVRAAGDEAEAAQVVEAQVVVAELGRPAAFFHEMREHGILLVDDRREPALGKREDRRHEGIDEFGLLQRAGARDVQVVADVVELALRHRVKRRRERRACGEFPAIQLLLARRLVLLHQRIDLLSDRLVVGDVVLWHK